MRICVYAYMCICVYVYMCIKLLCVYVYMYNILYKSIYDIFCGSWKCGRLYAQICLIDICTDHLILKVLLLRIVDLCV